MKTIVPPVVDDSGLAQRIRAEPERFLAECAREHGLVFTVVVEGGKRITYVLDPHVFQPLLTAPQVDFSPVSRQSKLRFGLGNVVADDEGVRNLSSGLIRSLRGQELRDTLSSFDRGFKDSLDGLRQELRGPTLMTIQSLAQRTLMPATVGALFGPEVFDERFVDDFLTYSSSVSTRFAGSNPSLDPKGLDAEKALMDRLAPALARAETPVIKTLSERVLNTGALSDEERLRTLLMLMWGSMVNLLPTSVWMYASVIQDAALVSSIREDDGDLRRSIVTEVLRLFSRPNMYREISEDFDLTVNDERAVHFTGGDWIALFPRFLHHDPEVFKDCREFQPARFQGDPTFHKDGSPLKHSTVVFGLGRGRCPGDKYSAAVLDCILAGWCRAFDAQTNFETLPPAVTDTVSSTPGPARMIDVTLAPTS